MDTTRDEAEELATDRVEWRQRVAQCNTIPEKLKSINKLDTFKKQLKRHLLNAIAV